MNDCAFATLINVTVLIGSACSQAEVEDEAASAHMSTSPTTDAHLETDNGASMDASTPESVDATDGASRVDQMDSATCSAASGCTGVCPEKFDDATIASLCGGMRRNVQVGTTPCGGVTAVLVGATDCDTFYLFDASTKLLVETGGGCNGHLGCTWSASGAPLASSCIHDHAGTWSSERGGGEFGLRDACEVDANVMMPDP